MVRVRSIGEMVEVEITNMRSFTDTVRREVVKRVMNAGYFGPSPNEYGAYIQIDKGRRWIGVEDIDEGYITIRAQGGLSADEKEALKLTGEKIEHEMTELIVLKWRLDLFELNKKQPVGSFAETLHRLGVPIK